MFKLSKALYRNQKGFTLVELMVVVVIIGVLVAIAIPVFNQVQANSARRAVEANLRTIDGAIAQFIAEQPGGAPPANIAALVPNYLVAIPSGPGGLPATAYGISDATPRRAIVTIAANTFGTHGAINNASLPLTWSPPAP